MALFNRKIIWGDIVKNLVECIKNNVYGFTKGEAYKIISIWHSDGESYIVKGNTFYDIVNNNGSVCAFEKSEFAKCFKKI